MVLKYIKIVIYNYVIITYLYILKLHSFRIAQKALCDANHIESSFPGNLQQLVSMRTKGIITALLCRLYAQFKHGNELIRLLDEINSDKILK